MIKALVSDFSRVLLSPKDKSYMEGLNVLHKKLSMNGPYDFWLYFQLNKDLLAFYRTLNKKIDLYLFTTEYIQEHPSIRPHMEEIFKTVFSGANLDLKKTDTQAYKIIAEKINLKPEEILYIDDKQKNLDAAESTGIATILYKSNDQVIKAINKILENN